MLCPSIWNSASSLCYYLVMNTMMYEMQRLQAISREKGPLCVGLDTDPSYLPPEIIKLYDSPQDAVLAYNLSLISTLAPYTACYKVQIAYYEAMGLSGLSVYSKTLKAIRKSGIPVIADIKRGDIADTARAYARAHFTGEFEADIITINPYMGFDTLEPFLEYVEKAGKGAFVLLRTSNPGMKDIEWLPVTSETDADKPTRVLDVVGSALQSLVQRFPSPDKGCSPFGAVVGCTEESDARSLRDRYPDLFFLIPGYGVQGGAARVAATLLDQSGGVVNSSRGILTAWQKSESLDIRRRSGSLSLTDIVEAASQAAFSSQADLVAAKKALSLEKGL